MAERARYKAYCELFGINKRAALYRTQREGAGDEELKPYEKFFSMLSVAEIESIIAYFNEDVESAKVNIKLTKHKRDK